MRIKVVRKCGNEGSAGKNDWYGCSFGMKRLGSRWNDWVKRQEEKCGWVRRNELKARGKKEDERAEVGETGDRGGRGQ